MGKQPSKLLEELGLNDHIELTDYVDSHFHAVVDDDVLVFDGDNNFLDTGQVIEAVHRDYTQSPREEWCVLLPDGTTLTHESNGYIVVPTGKSLERQMCEILWSKPGYPEVERCVDTVLSSNINVEWASDLKDAFKQGEFSVLQFDLLPRAGVQKEVFDQMMARVYAYLDRMIVP